MKALILSTLLLVTAFGARAQMSNEIEKGSPSELKGLTKVYIYTGNDKESLQTIRTRLEKELPQIKILDSPDEAEVALLFQGGTANSITRDYVNSPPIKIVQNRITRDKTGSGKVYLLLNEKRQKLVEVLAMSSRQDGAAEDEPAVKFVKQFIKAYKKANGSADRRE